MTLSLCGRAELIRALAQNDPSTIASVADMLGYHEAPHVEQAPLPELPSRPEAPEVVPTRYDPTDVPFWRLERYESISNDTSPAERPARTYTSWRRRPTKLPDFTPLASKRLVLTRLRQVSATRRTSRDIDDEAAVERLSRASFLGDLPTRQRRAWGSELLIVKDRARRLMPYWQDQDAVIDALCQLYPTHGLTVARLQDGERQPITLRGHPEAMRWPEAPVLVLSDLGCLSNERETLRRFWLDWGRRLRAQHTPAIALVPTHAKRIAPELARVWTLVQWDASPAMVSEVPLQSRSSAVECLLTLLSPAVRLEPGLVRAVRCLLPEGRRDAGLEAHIWQHEAIASPHSVAASWDPAPRKTYQSRFANLPETDRQAVLDLIRTWRANVHPAIWFEELIGLDEKTRSRLIDAADVEDAMAFLTVFAKAVWPAGEASDDTKAWAAGLLERLPDTAIHVAEVREALHYLYDLVHPDVEVSDVPWWYDTAVLPSPAGRAIRHVMVWQTADQLSLRVAKPSSLSNADSVVRGSPLGVVQTVNGAVKIAPGLPESTGAEFWRTRQPPAWAQHWGYDEFGPWVTFRVGAVEQRMRWIPPGRFWMGSPEDEEGRYDHEGPRHEVELTRGYWLFDTPCTQALWQAVMGNNPSEFQGEKRPVEGVSWEDCQTFMDKLNEALPGLEVRLPTEAQWEYACRAGTQGPRYDSDLDAIAWHAEISDRTTHEVRQKRPNAWGLYDMLGNVLEWCHDGRRGYTADLVTDPVGPTDAGAVRVARGGSWYSVARHVRAAYRLWNAPGDRFVNLGFRCSSSGMSFADGMRRERRRAGSGAREDRARSHDGGR